MSSLPTFRLLFVCMGNICRSPAAEGIMKKRIAEAGLADRVEIDSAGTGGWHAGELADSRMSAKASQRGYDLSSRARQVTTRDLSQFDLILIMDEQNRRDLSLFDPAGRHRQKVRLFCEFCTDHEDSEVPDPYYGGDAGFKHVLDLLEDGCANLLRHVESELKHHQ